MTDASSAGKRRDIQGLRALAVLFVLGFHYFPHLLPGGFVGVDVFFVISGYLITSSLARELRGSTTISLSGFYARRLRRLMPAALVAIVATVALVGLLENRLRFVHVLRDAAWAFVPFANVNFASAPQGYFSASEPSPLLHFWSLAVEEQFYLVWPLLLLIAWRFGRRTIFPAVAVLFAVSLAASIVVTPSDPTTAYYSLATRGWELAAGALLAVAPGFAVRRWVHQMVGSVGLVLVAASGWLISDQSTFPGALALLPVAGTVALIWSGTSGGGLQSLLGVRPLVFVGDMSYSVYLWHWPVLVLAWAVAGERPHGLAAVGLAALSLVIAAASYFGVEKPGLRFRIASFRRLVVGGVITAVVLSGGSATASAAVPLPSTEAVATGGSEPGPVPEGLPVNAEPKLADLDEDLADVFTDGCYADDLKVCSGGDPNGSMTVVLAGDSHAGQWWPAVDAAAKDRGWRLFIVGHNGCPLVDVRVVLDGSDNPWVQCDKWQVDAMEAIANLHPDVIVWANHASGYQLAVPSLQETFDSNSTWALGAQRTLTQLTGLAPVLVIGQMPQLNEEPGDCLAENPDDIAVCSTPIDVAIPPDVGSLTRSLAENNGAGYFDSGALLCTTRCPVMSRNLIIYRDSSHMTATFSLRLSGVIGNAIEAAANR